MPRYTKLNTYVRKTGNSGRRDAKVPPEGTFNSSTRMVMRIARTPSLNASRRALLIADAEPVVQVQATGTGQPPNWDARDAPSRILDIPRSLRWSLRESD